MKSIHLKHSIVILFLCSSCFGCNQEVQSLNPELTLQRALSSLSKQGQFAFEGTSGIRNSGLDIEHTINQLWHPTAKIEMINQIKHTTRIDLDQSDGNTVVLDVEMNSDAMKTVIQSKFRQTLKELNLSGLITQLTVDAALASKDKIVMKSEMNRTVLLAEKQLNGMLLTLKVESHYLFWVERTTLRSKKLYAETALTYLSDGQTVKEIIDEKYKYSPNDNGLIIRER